ncbi:hypothetical protein AAMO2058_000782800 [Amorphochlora amoebiformis]
MDPHRRVVRCRVGRRIPRTTSDPASDLKDNDEWLEEDELSPEWSEEERPKEEEKSEPDKESILLFDTYPTLMKKNCPRKALSNAIIVELAKKITCRDCLVLDAATALTSKALVEDLKRRKYEIYVPNMWEDTYNALLDKDICTPYLCSLSSFIHSDRCRRKTFGVIYLDYCSSLEGGMMKYSSTPLKDIKDIFHKKLISSSGCVLAVTLCSPNDGGNFDENSKQFSKLRHILAVLSAKADLYFIPHSENNGYDNWITEFYIIGSKKAIYRYYKIDSPQKDTKGFQYRRKRCRSTEIHTGSTSSVVQLTKLQKVDNNGVIDLTGD